MISVKLLNTALDAIKNSHPVAELAQNLINSGVTEEQLSEALKGRTGDPVANELQNCYRDIVLGVPSTNKYGVACKSNSTAKNSKKKAP